MHMRCTHAIPRSPWYTKVQHESLLWVPRLHLTIALSPVVLGIRLRQLLLAFLAAAPPCSGAAVDLLESAASAAGKGSQQHQRAVARSETVLLVKNLPYSATEAELEALFGALGKYSLGAKVWGGGAQGQDPRKGLWAGLSWRPLLAPWVSQHR